MFIYIINISVICIYTLVAFKFGCYPDGDDRMFENSPHLSVVLRWKLTEGYISNNE